MISLNFASCQPKQWTLRFYRTWALAENCPRPRHWGPSTKLRSGSCYLLNILGVQDTDSMCTRYGSQVSMLPWLPSWGLRHPGALSTGGLCWAGFSWKHHQWCLALTGGEKGCLVAHITLSVFHMQLCGVRHISTRIHLWQNSISQLKKIWSMKKTDNLSAMALLLIPICTECRSRANFLPLPGSAAHFLQFLFARYPSCYEREAGKINFLGLV